MNPITFATRQPLTSMVLVAAVALGSGLAIYRMPIDVFPNVKTDKQKGEACFRVMATLSEAVNEAHRPGLERSSRTGCPKNGQRRTIISRLRKARPMPPPETHDTGSMPSASAACHETQPPCTSSMIAALTSGVRPCQFATSSRSATQSRHSSNSPWVHLSQVIAEIVLASSGTRVQFPPPP